MTNGGNGCCDEGRPQSVGVTPATCACGVRPASACPGEWEQGCDLGANEQHARRAGGEVSAQVDAALRLAPSPGSRWTCKDWPHGAVAHVLGTVGGWVVWRRKGCEPQLRHVNQWHDGFVPAVPLRPKEAAEAS